MTYTTRSDNSATVTVYCDIGTGKCEQVSLFNPKDAIPSPYLWLLLDDGLEGSFVPV